MEAKNIMKNMARNLNIVGILVEHLYNKNVKLHPHTSNTKTYKRNKFDVGLTTLE